MKILLISLGGIAVLGGGYFAYTKWFSGSSQSAISTSEAAVTARPNVPTFDDKIFSDPRFYELTKQPYSGYTEQYEGIYLSTAEALPPTNLKVENPARGRTLIVSWDLPDHINFTKVRIYRSEDGVTATPVATLDVSASSASTHQTYEDTGLTDNRTYYYLVRSVTADNLESRNNVSVKNIPTDIVPPSAPTDVRVEPQTDATVEISWVNPTDAAKVLSTFAAQKTGGAIFLAETNIDKTASPAHNCVRYYTDIP